MEIKPVDYMILLIVGGVTQYTFWNNWPQISSTTAITGLFTVAYFMFVTFGEDIPHIRDKLHEFRKRYRKWRRGD